MGFEGQCQLLKGSRLAAARPTERSGELRISRLAHSRGHEDFPLDFLEAERATGFEMHA